MAPASPAAPEGAVIVGASVAGTHVAEQLRAHGYRPPITLIDAETRLPYDRPPLSKGVLLGTVTHDDIRLQADGTLAALDLDLHQGARAVALDGRTVRCADGRAFTGRHILLATGLSSRRLPGQPTGVASVRTLRTLDDALALRERMLASTSIAIVGAGLIGCEVASAARDLGLQVTAIESLPAPMTAALGDQAGQFFAGLLRDRGVTLLTSAAVTAMEADDTSATLTLADGTSITADTVLIAIGSVPNTAWLRSPASTATKQSGLICDATGQVHGHDDGVFAVGDIAAWPDPAAGGHRRQEHWMSARAQAAAVAATICGQPPAPPKPDYAWTDQFGLLIQILGRPDRADRTAQLEEKVLGYYAHDQLVGALILGAPRRKGHYNRLISAAGQ